MSDVLKPISGSTLSHSASLADLPLSYPFYRTKADDAFWYEEDQGVFDEEGVIMRDYGDDGVHYHPVLLSSYALRLYDTYRLTGEEGAGELFLRHAEQLANSLEPWYDAWAWVYLLPNAGFGAYGPWISGMAQGMCIAVLAQAEVLTGDHRFLERAEMALQVFDTVLADGGVRTSIPEGGCWYEEVAAPGVESSLILNGHVYAVVGLGCYAELTGDARALDLYHQGVEGVRSLLAQFDTGFASRYCLEPIGEVRPASQFYNLVHVQQLLELWRREGDLEFATHALRFLAYHADSLSKSEAHVYAIAEDGSQSTWVEDITDLIFDVKGVWASPPGQASAIAITGCDTLPLSGIAIREWQVNPLGDFDVTLRSDNEWLPALTVRNGRVSSPMGTVTTERVRNRNALVWYVALDMPCTTDCIRLLPLGAGAGLRQVILAHDYPLVAAPADTRHVLQLTVPHLFDASIDTAWEIPEDDVELLIMRNHPMDEMKLLWSASDGDIQSTTLAFSEAESVTLSIDSPTILSLITQPLNDRILRVQIRGGLTLGAKLHGFVAEDVL